MKYKDQTLVWFNGKVTSVVLYVCLNAIVMQSQSNVCVGREKVGSAGTCGTCSVCVHVCV